MKIGWIGGWGVSLEEMKAIALAHAPDAEHLIYPPVVGAAENLSGCDAVIAWSLGAHLVLEAGARGVQFQAKVLLFAPFTSFCSEQKDVNGAKSSTLAGNFTPRAPASSMRCAPSDQIGRAYV